MTAPLVLLAIGAVGGALGALIAPRLAWRRPTQTQHVPASRVVATVDTTECRKAVHEAGHAVAAWSCTGVTSLDVATIEGERGGYVIWNMRSDRTHEMTPEMVWHLLVIILAGVAAEAMVYSRSHAAMTAETDFAKARHYAEKLGNAPPPWSDVGGPLIAFQKIYVEPTLSPQTLRNLEAAYRMARHVVAAHGGHYYRVVSMLLARRTAKSGDIERVLGRRAHVRLLASFTTKFVLPSGAKAA